MIISIIQILLAAIIITLILLQERHSGLSGIFGGEGGGFYQARRGLEKIIFRSTVVLVILFATLSIAHLLLFK